MRYLIFICVTCLLSCSKKDTTPTPQPIPETISNTNRLGIDRLNSDNINFLTMISPTSTNGNYIVKPAGAYRISYHGQSGANIILRGPFRGSGTASVTYDIIARDTIRVTKISDNKVSRTFVLNLTNGSAAIAIDATGKNSSSTVQEMTDQANWFMKDSLPTLRFDIF